MNALNDRELLELAAKAYWGEEIDDVVSIEWGEQDNAILYTHADNQDHNGLDRTYCWNPLTDDGDALRLAVKLGMILVIGPCQIKASTTSGALRGNFFVEDMIFNDGNAATRRAIVRAAAEIGKAMP